MSLCDEGNFSWMEEPIQFDFESTSLQFPQNSVKNFEDLYPAIFKVSPSSCTAYNETPALVTETKLSAIKDYTSDDELFGTPGPITDDNDEIDEKWEDELAQLSDREVPSIGMDENIKQMLVELPVKQFNVKTKEMKLDAKVLQHLKLCRKRLKNRQAAIRSRSKKENETVYLQKRVDELLREKKEQDAEMKRLLQRVVALEKQVANSA